MYKPEYFTIRELVPPQVYNVRGEKSLQLLDDRALITIDTLRKEFGPAVINSWSFWKKDKWYGEVRKWSGLRIKGCPYGSQFSQHRYGRAFDMIFKDTSAEVVRQDILANPDKYPHIMSLELGVPWLHFDTRNCDRIMTYTP